MVLIALMVTIALSPTAQAVISVERGDFSVPRAYPALFFVHVVCMNDAGDFGDDSVCKVKGGLTTGYTPIPGTITGRILGCAPMTNGAAFHWHLNGPSAMMLPTGQKHPGEWFGKVILSCGELASAIANLSDAERSRYYADCEKVTHGALGHCFVFAKLEWGHLLGYAVFEPLERAPTTAPTTGKIPPNGVCIEPDQEAHPLSECPGFTAEEIDDSAFPAKLTPSSNSGGDTERRN